MGFELPVTQPPGIDSVDDVVVTAALQCLGVNAHVAISECLRA